MPKYALLYQNLLDELLSIFQITSPEQEKVEACFKCSVRYWEAVKLLVEQEDFEDDEEEIRFFRYEKPRFTGMIEHFILRYQALVFMPFAGPDIAVFWRKELSRVHHFYTEHSRFYMYYHSGDTAQDKTWFVRASGVVGTPDKSRVYNQDPRTSCPKDWTAAMVIASDLYRQYIQDAMLHHL